MLQPAVENQQLVHVLMTCPEKAEGSSSKAPVARAVQSLLPAVSCLLYMFTGPWLILVNQRIMTELDYRCPIALSALGVIASALVAHLSVRLGVAQIRPQTLESISGRNWYTCILPIALSYAGTLGLGNAAYLFLGVGFIQMLKAFTPVVVLIVLVVLKLESPTLPVIGFVTLISLGTLVTAATAPEWSPMGLLLMSAATGAEALRVALTQYLLTSCSFTVLEGQYLLAPVVSAMLLLAAAFTEFPQALSEGFFWVPLLNPEPFLLATALGTAVNYLSYLVIQTSGALALKVVTMLRNMGLILYTALVLLEPVSSKQSVGYAIALIGFFGYSHFSHRESTNVVVPTELPAAKKA